MSAATNHIPPEPEQIARVPVVLLVEDEVLIRFALAEYLRERGFKVYEAGNAAEAIQLLSFYKTEIDVVFSDVRMPGPIDGFALAIWIRQNRPGVPVILTSGEVRGWAGESPPQDIGLFFRKPYDLHAVVAQIEAAAAKRIRGTHERA